MYALVLYHLKGKRFYTKIRLRDVLKPQLSIQWTTKKIFLFIQRALTAHVPSGRKISRRKEKDTEMETKQSWIDLYLKRNKERGQRERIGGDEREGGGAERK